MCTVTFMPRKRGYCLGMNRDEKRLRAKGLPPTIRNIHGHRVLYPSEPTGGTWIALNDRGVSFALLNWYSVPARANVDQVSRGEVIPSIAAAGSPAIADVSLFELPLGRMNPFRLVGVFPESREITEWRWDSKQLARKPHRWRNQQWTSSGFDEPTAQRARSRAFKKTLIQKSAGTLAWLRRLHRSHSPHTGPFSICMHRDEAATVSYTEISVLPCQGSVRHRSGAACEFSESSFHSLRLFP